MASHTDRITTGKAWWVGLECTNSTTQENEMGRLWFKANPHYRDPIQNNNRFCQLSNTQCSGFLVGNLLQSLEMKPSCRGNQMEGSSMKGPQDSNWATARVQKALAVSVLVWSCLGSSCLVLVCSTMENTGPTSEERWGSLW